MLLALDLARSQAPLKIRALCIQSRARLGQALTLQAPRPFALADRFGSFGLFVFGLQVPIVVVALQLVGPSVRRTHPDRPDPPCSTCPIGRTGAERAIASAIFFYTFFGDGRHLSDGSVDRYALLFTELFLDRAFLFGDGSEN